MNADPATLVSMLLLILLPAGQLVVVPLMARAARASGPRRRAQ